MANKRRMIVNGVALSLEALVKRERFEPLRRRPTSSDKPETVKAEIVKAIVDKSRMRA